MEAVFYCRWYLQSSVSLSVIQFHITVWSLYYCKNTLDFINILCPENDLSTCLFNAIVTFVVDDHMYCSLFGSINPVSAPHGKIHVFVLVVRPIHQKETQRKKCTQQRRSGTSYVNEEHQTLRHLRPRLTTTKTKNAIHNLFQRALTNNSTKDNNNHLQNQQSPRLQAQTSPKTRKLNISQNHHYEFRTPFPPGPYIFTATPKSCVCRARVQVVLPQTSSTTSTLKVNIHRRSIRVWSSNK